MTRKLAILGLLAAGCTGARARLVEIAGEGYRQTGFLAGRSHVATALLPEGRVARASTLWQGDLRVLERADLGDRGISVLRVEADLGLPPEADRPRAGPGTVLLWRAGLPRRHDCSVAIREDGTLRVFVRDESFGPEDRGAPVLQDDRVVAVLARGVGWNEGIARPFGAPIADAGASP
ncbi:MAG: hypothetical protein L0216_04300 [Planctomycetales bacterium]|nr:hypothetical protein [Planctomycetales bacterium]